MREVIKEMTSEEVLHFINDQVYKAEQYGSAEIAHNPYPDKFIEEGLIVLPVEGRHVKHFLSAARESRTDGLYKLIKAKSIKSLIVKVYSYGELIKVITVYQKTPDCFAVLEAVDSGVLTSL